MISPSARPLRITWLAPDDRGGGVISVAQGCCRQAAIAGHDVTLLLALAPTGHAAEFGGLRVESLDAVPPYADIPARLVAWLRANPQDILVLNGCEQADFAIPFLPTGTRVIYGVHDSADRYFAAALRHEAVLDAVVAVSETVAVRLRHRLRDSRKLHVILNGTIFPVSIDDALSFPRADDLLFLGGDNSAKGAYDAIEAWSCLVRMGYTGRLHWFGAMGETFRERIAALPEAGRIVICGRQPRQAVLNIAVAAKVILMLSRAESFGMATIECMGMGCVPVAWDIATGTKEIVAEGEGIFVPLADYDALARGILDAIELHGSRFAASTTRIRTEFTEAVMWTRYAAAFEAILATPPAPRPRAGETPPLYRPPLRLYQLLPSGLRSSIRAVVGRSPRIGYALRDFRGR